MPEIKKLVSIIGSPKAGTSALFEYLGRHPKVIPGRIKEPRFFTRWSERSWAGPGTKGFLGTLIQDEEEYHSNFEGLGPDQWALDGSTDYLWCPESLGMLSAFENHCDLRLICIVRDPVARAVSEYNMTLGSNWETLSFRQSLDAEETRMRQGWLPAFYHKRRSMVAADIRRFADHFGDRLLVIDYSDMRDDGAVMSKISDFINIEEVPVAKMKRKNEAFVRRSPTANIILNSKVLKHLGSRILPQRTRQFIWDSLHANSRDVVTAKPAERAYLRAQLAEEIAACVVDPLIPTDNWTCLPDQDVDAPSAG